MTTQGLVAVDGNTKFTLTAFVPVGFDNVGRTIDIEFRKSTANGDTVIGSCSYTVLSQDADRTIPIPCNRFEVIPYSAGDGAVSIYPYVILHGHPSSGGRIHDGKPYKLPVTTVYDDNLEENDTFGTAKVLGSVDSLNYTDLVSRDADFYKITVPAGRQVTEVGIKFWHEAADLDLYFYNSAREFIGVSDSYGDSELVWFAINPGGEYYIKVNNFSGKPAFYDLGIQHGTNNSVTILYGPEGTPDPVGPNSNVDMEVEGYDWASNPLNFHWTASCPMLPSNGSFDSATSRTPRWDSPSNPTGSQQVCTITVTATNAAGQSDSESYEQLVDASWDFVTISGGPVGDPNPAPSGGTVYLTVTASDTQGHPLAYEWHADCPYSTSGGFSPSPFVASPTWIAPTNSSGGMETCTISVTAIDAFSHATTASYAQKVDKADVVTIDSGPTATPTVVESGASLALDVTASDSFAHSLNYSWQAVCPLGSNGTFSPSAWVRQPTWVAPVNATGSSRGCNISVQASDSGGHSSTRSLVAIVNSIADVVTITAGPTGSDNPVASGGNVILSVAASDSIVGHVVSFAWSAVCPALSGPGTFIPNPTYQTPTWVAPFNYTGAEQTCTLTATASDAGGHTDSRSLARQVAIHPHTLQLHTHADAEPNPIGSQQTTHLTVLVVDSYSHELSYNWWASCPAALGGSGTFAPSASAPDPMWTAPANLTGSNQPCEIWVTVSDGHGKTITDSYVGEVEPRTHTLTLTTGPVGAPNPIASGGTVALNAEATDSYPHSIAYSWQAICPNILVENVPTTGAFTPDATGQTPSWIAPENRTGFPQTCTITVTANDGAGKTAQGSYAQTVNSIADTITITSGPSGGPSPVDPGGSVTLTSMAIDSIESHTLHFAWTAACPTLPSVGSFVPGSQISSPSWMAPANLTGSDQTCTLTLTVTDGHGKSATGSFDVVVHSVAHSLTVTGPTATPATVAPGGTIITHFIATDTLQHALTYSWQASCPNLPASGTFKPNAQISAPVWAAPVNATTTQQTCTLTVSVDDGHGSTVIPTVLVYVNPAPHQISFTSGPGGTPNPVASGNVQLGAVAHDSYDHDLTYLWESACPGIGTGGTFAPAPNVANASWVPPANQTGTAQNCTLTVTATDTQGVTGWASYIQTIDAPTHEIVVTQIVGTPDPVLPRGSQLMHLAATDTFGHTLSYHWDAVCPGLPTTGSFFPNANTMTPIWEAADNPTSDEQTCTLTVTITDGLNQTTTASFVSHVTLGPDTVSITAGPAGSPNPVASGAAVALSVTAVDSRNHPLTYEWQATCPGLTGPGTFAPSAGVAAPAWTSPENRTGTQQPCGFQVNVHDEFGHASTGSWSVMVDPKPDTVTITQGPAGAPNPVASGGAVALSVAATDSFDHALTFAWQATCPTLPDGGTFNPGPAGTSPTWTAPVNVTGAEASCTLEVTANDGSGHTANASFVEKVSSVGDGITITSAAIGSADPVMSGGTVALTVTATDSLNHDLTYAWTSVCSGSGDAGSFTPAGNVPAPTWTAPVNISGSQRDCTLTVTITDGHGHSATSIYVAHVQSANAITVTGGPGGNPNPVKSHGTVNVQVNATNVLNRTLTFAWTASCPTLATNGTFGSPASASGPWMAPENLTAVVQTCTLQVVISDGVDTTKTVSFNEQVRPLNTLTLSPITSDNNPVSSGGQTGVHITATDTLGLTLTYLWKASCPALGVNGGYDSVSVAHPVWTAPANLTGAPKTCVISVTVSDGQDQTKTATFLQTVSTVPQNITVSSGPAGSPNPVVSGGAITTAVTATDILGRTLAYEWSASCPALPSNGAFTNPAAPSTQWVAPVNTTGSPQICTITVRINDGLGNTPSFSYEEIVGSIPAISSGGGAVVPSGGSITLNLLGSNMPGQQLTYSWSASCTGLPGNGSFDNPVGAAPVWTAPVNYTGSVKECLLSVVIRDGQGQTQNASFKVFVDAADCTYTVDPLTIQPGLAGGTTQITVESPCAWAATPSAGWLQLSGTTNATGNGTFTVTVGAADPAQRTATITVGDKTIQVTQQGKGYTYYLAEGATINGFFQTRIALLNVDATEAASVSMDFSLKDTTTVLTHTLSIGAHQRATVIVSELASINPALAALASAEFSTAVHSNVPLVVDRTMSWDQTGYGGHSETSLESPSSIWYLAEGATLGNFELYYLIQNPNSSPLNNEVEVTYLLPPPRAPIVRTYSMGANTRMNIAVHMEPGLEDAEVSAIIKSPGDKPIIVERAMYMTTGGLFYGAGHESAGIRSPQRQWFFAEGATGSFFDLFILIGNPNDEPAHVTATYLFGDGTTCTTPVGNTVSAGQSVVGAKSRHNIWVDMEVLPSCPYSLSDAAISTTINSDVPIVAERSMWWPGPTPATWAESHNSPGATSTGTRWAFADGEQGFSTSVETYALIANTSDYDGTAKVTLYFEDGSSVEKTIEIVRNGRTTVPIGADRDGPRQALGQPERSGFGFGSVPLNKRFGVVIESLPVAGQDGPAKIVVERAMYWNGPGTAYWAAGTNALASKLQ